MNALELYSGIGGMHWALRDSGVNFKLVMAVDINTSANQIYKANFPNAPLHGVGIEKLTLRQLESLDIDAILMSPPCQPFTRKGKKGDCNDPRTNSFMHVLDLLKKLTKKPGYLLVENVKGFEVSQTRERLIQCLQSCGYIWQEFLLSPLQFGIPNCRLRYYLLAKWKEGFAFPVQTEIMTEIPIIHPHHFREQPSEDYAPPSAPRKAFLNTEEKALLSTEPGLKENASSHTKSDSSISQFKDCDTPNTKPSSNSCSPSCDNCETKSVGSESTDLNRDQSLDGQSIKGVKRKETDFIESSNTRPQSLPRLSHSSNGGANCDVSVSNSQIINNGKESEDERKKYFYDSPQLKIFKGGNTDVIVNKTQEIDNVKNAKDNSGRRLLSLDHLAALKDAGRTMRFCEKEDGMVLSTGRHLWEFMEEGSEEDFEDFLLSDRELKLFNIMDIVFPELKKSTCFTKRYGHYIDAAGSVVQMTTNVKAVEAASALKEEVVQKHNRDQWTENEWNILRKLKLRYFTPREVANLLCFPKEFVMPEGFTKVQLYRVLGNSLNVHVVSELIKLLTAKS